MKISKWLVPAALVAILAVTNVFAITYADYEEGQNPENPNQQNMEAMKAAVESGDYIAFTEVAPDKLLEVINADNFGRFQEMHQHMEAAKAIAEELGLPKMKQNKGKMKGQMKNRMENHEEIVTAIESGDYDAWLEIVTENGKNLKIFENITEENFHLLQELHEAKQNQDFETAKELAEQLGFPEKPMQKRGRNF